nr:hypothetical protein [Kibdelosporangium sp. MJ126-NF4]
MVLVAGSGQAHGADTTLRRLVMRFLLLAGFTAAGWLATVVLTGGTASADLITLPKVPGLSSDQAKSSTPKDESGHGDLVGGLLGGVTSTVNNTLATVTTTVTSTVDMVTKTVETTVNGVTKTVTTVVDEVAKVPGKVLTPQPPSNNDDHDGSLLPKPVTDLLTPQPKTPSQGKDTITDRAANETAVETAAPAATPVVVVAPTVTAEALEPEHPRLLQEARRTQELVAPAPAVRALTTAQKVAPADNTPGPRPGPQAPVAPATPAPTASAGGNGGSDVRAILAVLTPQTLLTPPQAGLPRSDESFAEVGRSAGLPATPPD